MEIVFALIAVLLVDGVVRRIVRARRQTEVCFSRPPGAPLSTL